MVTTDENSARLAFEFQRSDWKAGLEGFWVAELPAWTRPLRRGSAHVPRPGLDPPDDPYLLRDEQGEYHFRLAGQLKGAPDLAPRSFMVLGKRLFVNVGAGEPPERVALEVREERRSGGEDGRRYRNDHLSGEALVVWPGEALEMELELPPRSALHFGLASESRLHRAFEHGRELVFSVALDGAALFTERIACGDEALRWRAVTLPAAGGPARLSFSVQGPFTHTAFLAPTVGPLEQGVPGARPWGHTRPDVIVFLADTFRADNLAAHGGPAELTPDLNELAARSRLFACASSTATYTLAAHASLFTGVFPRQAGIVDPNSAISPGLPTLAELFTELGYRTGAITDQGYVSQTFGMDRGFEIFDERRRTLAEMAERIRAFLEADDGRPVFLFVQTYRTHMPYEVSDEACAALGLERLPTSRLSALELEYNELLERETGTREDLRHRAELATLLERHYRASVWDLDRGFGDVLRALEARDYFRAGYLVFTSDHGEAFDEHERLGHSGEVYEEQVRVPLLIHGPGLRAERVEQRVSLVDLPRTLAELVGAEPPPGWLGTSLLELAEERAIYSFQSHRRDKGGSSLCVIEGNRKVIGQESADELRAGSLLHAFDLASDPAEHRDDSSEAWARELFERHRPVLDVALTPRGALDRATPSAEELQGLEDLGYAGGDD